MKKYRNKFKKMILPMISFCMIGMNQTVYAEGEETHTNFKVVDFVDQERIISEYDSYHDAYQYYEEHMNEYDNLGILKDDKVMQVEYGIALINKDHLCDVNLEFTNVEDRNRNYTNGCFGADAAYINTDRYGTTAHFYISSVEGEVNVDDLDIIPLNQLSTTLSNYVVKDGNLYHQIKGEMSDDYYENIIKVGQDLPYLEEGKVYYSYDGHYFYQEENLYQMLDDYKHKTFEHAVNVNEPYYDYYQFVSHRTLTSITKEDLESYFTNTIGMKQSSLYYQDDDRDSMDDQLTSSQLFDTVDAFYEYQYEYGVNALMMCSLSQNESGNGHSYLAMTRNNLFGHAAYDNDVEANASRYFNVERSIYTHAKYYISGSYCCPKKFQYHGGFFGNKANGMNVSYASDPYWGEKAASYYRKLDEAFGSKDLNRYTLGIRTGFNDTLVYANPSNDSSVLYDTGSNKDMAFVILDTIENEDGKWYKIQADATLNQEGVVDIEYHYDYAVDVAYIKADEIQLVIDGKNDLETSFSHVTFDGDGGQFVSGEEVVGYTLPNGSMPSITTPTKDHAIFDHFEPSIEVATKDATYTAIYRNVESIALKDLPKQEYELDSVIDVRNGSIQVQFEDGTTSIVPLTLGMVSNFDLFKPGDQEVTVTYAGCSVTYPIHVSEEVDLKKKEVRNQLIELTKNVNDVNELSEDQIKQCIELKKTMDEYGVPYLNMPLIRKVDACMMKALDGKQRYVVSKNKNHLAISGLALSTPMQSDDQKKSLFKDTIRVSYKNGISRKDLKAIQTCASYIGTPVGKGFKVNLTKNYHDLHDLMGVVVTFDKPNDANEADVFTVLQVEKDGTVKRCYTRQTKDTISFVAHGSGSYQLVKRLTSNVYDEDRPNDVLDASNSDKDVVRNWIIVLILALFGSVGGFFGNKEYQKRQGLKIEKLKEELKAQSDVEEEVIEVTQALHILNTQVLTVEEIQKAAKEMDDANDDK